MSRFVNASIVLGNTPGMDESQRIAYYVSHSNNQSRYKKISHSRGREIAANILFARHQQPLQEESA